jgi:hypothetical protein
MVDKTVLQDVLQEKCKTLTTASSDEIEREHGDDAAEDAAMSSLLALVSTMQSNTAAVMRLLRRWRRE